MVGKLVRVRVLMRGKNERVWEFRMVREESFNSQMGEICLNRAKFALEYRY